jgi:predicted nucleic acid-binding protein
MTYPFLNTDVIIRLVTGDDPAKQVAAQALFERIEQGQETVQTTVTVIADAVYVLSSPRLYHLPRAVISGALGRLASLPYLRVRQRRTVLRALQLYAGTNLDFGDVFILASMEQARSTALYSYDQGFDRISSITRREP